MENTCQAYCIVQGTKEQRPGEDHHQLRVEGQVVMQQGDTEHPHLVQSCNWQRCQANNEGGL